MGADAARKTDDTSSGTPSARRSRDLRLVTPDEFALAAAKAAQEAGQPSDVVLGFLAGALAESLPDNAKNVLGGDGGEPDPAEVRRMLYIGELLQSRIRQFMTDLRAAVPIEVSSSEVRKNWAEYLESVRAREETVYITQHGRRVAALVPPYVAESYANDQAWFHTPEWREKEAQADADFAEGRVVRHESDESFLAALAEDVEDE
jgi:prevent-host-death family protein